MHIRAILLLSLLSTCPIPAAAQVGGVYIDAEGVLRDSSKLTDSERLKQLGVRSAQPSVATDLAAPSLLRKVSLAQLERFAAALAAEGKPLPDEMQHIAGLQNVRYLFFYPQSGDVVLAGPAEGWKRLPTGEIVGQRSSRPVLHLDDLLVALRFAFETAPRDAFLGCSIEPTTDGLQNYARYLQSLGSMDRSRVNEVMRGMEDSLGLQQIRLFGAPPDSRFALTMAAADYRLKRLAMGHDPSPVKSLVSYLDLAAKNLTKTSGPQQQHRWWFVGHFDAIRHTPDKLAFEFEGQGVKVLTAPSLPALSGGNAPKPARSATLFAESATRNFPALAVQIPVFQELKNLIELSLVAEIIRQQADGAVPSSGDKAAAVPEKTTPWRPVHFLDDRARPLTSYSVPQHTPSLANVRLVRDRHWMFSVSGGVEISPAVLANPEKHRAAEGEKLQNARPSTLPANAHWWWD